MLIFLVFFRGPGSPISSRKPASRTSLRIVQTDHGTWQLIYGRLPFFRTKFNLHLIRKGAHVFHWTNRRDVAEKWVNTEELNKSIRYLRTFNSGGMGGGLYGSFNPTDSRQFGNTLVSFHTASDLLFIDKKDCLTLNPSFGGNLAFSLQPELVDALAEAGIHGIHQNYSDPDNFIVLIREKTLESARISRPEDFPNENSLNFKNALVSSEVNCQTPLVDASASQ